MAFDCPEISEDCLSDKKLNIVVHNPLKGQLASLHSGEKIVNCENKNNFWRKKTETLVPKSNFGSDKIVGALVGPVKLVTTNVGDDLDCRRSITDLPPALVSEILNCLDPKELGIVSCVSSTLYKIASDHSVWKDFYCERWGLPVVKPLNPGLSDEKSWKELFVEREFRSRTFLGQYRPDFLTGHKEAVRAVFLLSSAKLVFTSGYDSVVRIGDLEEGLSIDSSRPLGCTIRAVAADTKLLVAGGSDGFIQCWLAVEGVSHLFDLKGSQCPNSEFRLWEHDGPITSSCFGSYKDLQWIMGHDCQNMGSCHVELCYGLEA